jgi:hypothetical protein
MYTYFSIKYLLINIIEITFTGLKLGGLWDDHNAGLDLKLRNPGFTKIPRLNPGSN